eukprot:9975688-Alexandrium_andersonii.AAC.1
MDSPGPRRACTGKEARKRQFVNLASPVTAGAASVGAAAGGAAPAKAGAATAAWPHGHGVGRAPRGARRVADAAA